MTAPHAQRWSSAPRTASPNQQQGPEGPEKGNSQWQHLSFSPAKGQSTTEVLHVRGQWSTADLTRKRDALVLQKLPSEDRTAWHSVPLHMIRYLRLKQTDIMLSIGTTKNQVAHVDVNFTTPIPRDANAQIGNLFLPHSVRAGFANILAIMPSTRSLTTSWKQNVCTICTYICTDPHHQGGMNNPVCWTKWPHTNTYVDISWTQKHSLDFVLYSPLNSHFKDS